MAKQFGSSAQVLTCVIKDGWFNGAIFEIGISRCNIFKIALVKECVLKEHMFKVHLCEPVEKILASEWFVQEKRRHITKKENAQRQKKENCKPKDAKILFAAKTTSPLLSCLFLNEEGPQECGHWGLVRVHWGSSASAWWFPSTGPRVCCIRITVWNEKSDSISLGEEF